MEPCATSSTLCIGVELCLAGTAPGPHTHTMSGALAGSSDAVTSCADAVIIGLTHSSMVAVSDAMGPLRRSCKLEDSTIGFQPTVSRRSFDRRHIPHNFRATGAQGQLA
jgi:hypothetical protein